jgi:hypothetical protein
MFRQQSKNITLPFDIFGDVLSFDVKSKTGLIGVDSNLSRFFRGRVRQSAPVQDTVCIFGVGRDDTSIVLRTLKTHGIDLIHGSSSKRCLSDVIPADIGTTYLIVNVDAMGDLEDAVDELITFRKRCRNVVVVMISACVLSDDFGSYRQLICDATLRSPISQSRFEDALIAAKQNNCKRPVNQQLPVQSFDQFHGMSSSILLILWSAT